MLYLDNMESYEIHIKKKIYMNDFYREINDLFKLVNPFIADVQERMVDKGRW